MVDPGMKDYAGWLRGLAEKGGKGVVNNVDARCLGRIADELEHLRAAQMLPGCQLRGPGECQKEGKCLSASCVNYGKTEYRPRMTLEAQVDGILYPNYNQGE
jgi:hypothetical protein